jgi:tyrosinase
MAIRTSIRGAEANPSQIDRLRRAYERFKSLNDDRSFDFFASLHGLSLPVWCEHGTPLFLPWHRAYLYYFELALQSRLGARLTKVAPQVPEFANVGLPWWDWASPESHSSGIPDSYAAETANQLPNPLFNSAIGACGDGRPYMTGVWSSSLLALVRQRLSGTVTPGDPPTTQRHTDAPDDLPTQATVTNRILNQTVFEDFSQALEQAHNQVHVWVGGAMSQVPTAAYDPIFWSHHSMVDRVWYIWQLSPNGADPPAEMLDTVLTPFPMTVRDTLSIANLGYDYAVQAVA